MNFTIQDVEVKVTKNGDRKFWLAYVVVDGKRGQTRSIKATTKREAERFTAVWEAELREGRYKPASSITWQEFRERYEPHGAAPYGRQHGHQGLHDVLSG